MKAIRALLLLIIPAVAAAHPGGGLIALDANTVIFGDSMYNAVWRLEQGQKPHALGALRRWRRLLIPSSCSKAATRPTMVSACA